MTLACVANSMANFDVLARQKLGGEQKKERGPRGRGEKETPAFLLSPFPLFLFLCSRPNFREAKTLKFSTETLATQAKMPLPDLTGGGKLYHTTSKLLQKATYNPDYCLNISFDIPLCRLKK